MTTNEFRRLMAQLTFSDIARAAAALAEGHRPRRFRSYRGWYVVIAKQRFPHRRLIALAVRRYLDDPADRKSWPKPSDFKGIGCQKVLRDLGFTIRQVAMSKPPSLFEVN